MKEDSLLKRLRSAKLRPTIGRIGVMQVLQSAAGTALSAEDVFRRLMERGTHTSIGTVYRTVQQCEAAGLLLREWDEQRRSLYRIKPLGFDQRAMYLLCRVCERSFAVDDAKLAENLARVMQQAGIRSGEQTVTIELTCCDCARTRYAS